MTEEQLREIDARAAAATPGPWVQGCWVGRCHLPHQHGQGNCRYDYTLRHDGEHRREVSPAHPVHNEAIVGRGEYGPLLSDQDAAFIAHAREDMPELLAEVRRLRNERDTLLGLLAWAEYAHAMTLWGEGYEHERPTAPTFPRPEED